MQHYILRCKHCHKTYTYCTHGNDDGCSKDYCGECQTAIDNALGKIKVKFQPKFVEIKPTFGLSDMLGEIREKETKKLESDDLRFPAIVCLNVPDCEYDNVEEFTHEGKTYRIAWDDGNENEQHYFIQMEYDVEKGAVTSNVWRAETYNDSYRKGKSAKHLMKSMMKHLETAMVNPKPMKKPSALLSFMDFDWDIKMPDKPKRVPKHELRTYTVNYDGAFLKMFVGKGRNYADGYVTNIPPEGYNPEDVNEMLEYKVTISKYDDENVETITNIKVK